ncbi:hypothetical protein GHT06_015496 [Daphnia sinensis]|uniref:Uncharacterized protein n=1 Tax=Daphnia sinensis TaxID=1820382 RepID=A0AAD5PTC9_9CRUS|nr:hypothetical protein GHT06_015496 [Daphnia sinensis]
MFLSDGDEQFLDAVLELFTPGSYIKIILKNTLSVVCILFDLKKKYFILLLEAEPGTKRSKNSFLPASLDGKKHLTLSVVTEKPTTMTKKHKER